MIATVVPQPANYQLQLNPQQALNTSMNALNQYPQMVPLVMMQQQQVPVVPVQQSEVEILGEAVMKGASALQIERFEDCIQCCSLDFRDVTYDSHLGSHKVKRFQPCSLGKFICQPLKRCCCNYTEPMSVTNDRIFIEDLEIKFINRYHGFVSVKGVPLGTLTLEDPSLFLACLCGAQPKVIIRKAGTGESFTMKANDNCCQMLLERCCGCFIQSKDMLVEGGGTSLKGKYSRTCPQACVNFCTGSVHFFNKLGLEFYQAIKHDSDKVLLYAAFIFLQENTNSCFGI